MSRTVIRVVDTSTGGHEFSIEQTPVPNVRRTAAPFPLVSTNPPFAGLWATGALAENAVRAAGESLLATLRGHPPAEAALTWNLQQPPGKFAPIFLDLDTPESESFPWEALFATDFMALDDRWPIGRLAARADVPLLQRTVEPQLRVTIVISAAAIAYEDEEAEWKAISTALAASPVRPVCQVLVSSAQLKAAIDAQALPSTSTEFVGPDRDALQKQVTSFGPNIIHFFCHGSTAPRPQLQIAHRIDRLNRAEEGSLRADGYDLAWLGDLDTLLLVTLNCCQGGRTSAAVRALGAQLVEQGVPAAIAMRENVTPGTAQVFTSGFYRNVATLSGALVGGGAPPVLDGTQWAHALCEPRRRIAQAANRPQTLMEAAANGVEWIVPLLYVHRAPVQVVRRVPRAGVSGEDQARLRNKLATYRGYRRQQPAATTPPEILADVDRRITDVEGQLYAAP